MKLLWKMNPVTGEDTKWLLDNPITGGRTEAFNTKICISSGVVTGLLPCAMNYRISGARK
jgi:hypothetical protein